MKVMPFVEDLLSYYIQKEYPQEIIVVINYPTDSDKDIYLWVDKFCEDNDIEFLLVMVHERIILKFDTEDEAIDFCNSVPVSSPYCAVYSHGEVIHENS